MSGVAKIDIAETEEALKALLLKAETAENKEKLQALYWLKTQRFESVSAIAVLLGRHRTTVQRWLTSYSLGRNRGIIKREKESRKTKTVEPRNNRETGSRTARPIRV